MPVSTTESGVLVQGDGIVTEFFFYFGAATRASVKVGEVTTSGVNELPLADYTVTLNSGNLGGKVDFVTAPSSGVTLYIFRATPQTQLVGITSQNKYDPKVVQGVWDKLTFLVQELSGRTDRALLVPPGAAPADLLDNIFIAEADALQAAQDAAASAAEAALYDGPKADTIAIAKTITAGMVPVGGYLRITDIGAVWQRAPDATPVVNNYPLQFAGGPKWFVLKTPTGENSAIARGVPSDGTNAAAALTSMFSQGGGRYSGGGETFTVTDTFTVPSKSHLSGFSFEGSTGGDGTIVLPSGLDGLALEGVYARMTSGHLLGVSNTDAKDVLITGWNVQTERYPVLINDFGGALFSTMDGLIVANSFLKSDKSDPIELNAYEGYSKNFVGSGLILEAGLSGTSNASGFAYGNASWQYSVLSGAVIKGSRKQAIQIEDRQRGTVVNAVSGHGIKEHGIVVVSGGVSAPVYGDQDPIIATSIHMTHAGTKTAYFGIQAAFGIDGTLELNNFSNSYYKGFGALAYLGGNPSLAPAGPYVPQIVDNVVGDDLDCGIHAAERAIHLGTVTLRETPLLAKAGGGARLGTFVSKTTPTTILQKIGGQPNGVTMRGFIFPVPITHVSGLTDHNLFDLPTRMLGQITLSSNGANRFFYTATMKWDGSALTVSDSTFHASGGSYAFALKAAGGKLQFTMNSASASTDPCLVEFDGVFYKA